MAEKIYLIQWFGPFKSIADLAAWEAEQDFSCNLYLFQGKLQGKGQRRVHYYCGMTFRQASVSVRFRNANHHIHEFEGRPDCLNIWVGCISNIRKVSEDDVKLCEKMLTSEIVQIELSDEQVVNRTNFKAPVSSVYIINEWFDTHLTEHRTKAALAIPNKVPDVISYYAPEKLIYKANRLMRVGKLD